MIELFFSQHTSINVLACLLVVLTTFLISHVMIQYENEREKCAFDKNHYVKKFSFISFISRSFLKMIFIFIIDTERKLPLGYNLVINEKKRERKFLLQEISSFSKNYFFLKVFHLDVLMERNLLNFYFLNCFISSFFKYRKWRMEKSLKV